MPGKNYYVILGIDESESPSGIKGAFRERVKQYHPDRAGPEGTQPLQEVIEAYEHLSDPERRRQYNDTLRAQLRPHPVARPRPEPLVPEPVSGVRGHAHVRPSSDALFDRMFGNMSATDALEQESPGELNLNVVLSPEEAAFGVEIPVRIPVSRRCPRCAGSGHDWLFPCRYCLQTGFIDGETRIHVRIPPMVRDGSIIEIAGERLRIRGLVLRLRVGIR